MNSLDSGVYMDQFSRNCGLGIVFYPNVSLFSVEFQFRIVISVNFILNFGNLDFMFRKNHLSLILNFSTKSYQIS